MLADDAFRSLAAKRIVENPAPPKTIADGLLTNLVPRTFAILSDKVEAIARVTETQIVEAMRFLWERMKLVVEPSGAVALAAVLSGGVPARGQKVGVIISGGNIDLNDFFALLEHEIARRRD
jgi:threonine dehydratase